LAASILLPVFWNVSCTDDNQAADAYGNFESDEVLVSAQSQGIVLSLEVDEGDLIEKGRVVGMIDTGDAVIKRNQLLAQLDVNRAKLGNLSAQLDVQEEQRKNLVREVDRMQNLLRDGAATQQQYDDIEGRLSVLLSQTSALESQRSIISAEREVLAGQLSEIERLLDKCRILNPVTGTVLEKYAEAGELVVPGRTIYKIASLEEMELKFYISGDQLASVAIGDSIQVSVDLPDNRMSMHTGVVTWISSEVEFTPKIIQTKEERVNMVYAAKLRVSNHDRQLKIGMPGEVLFMNDQETR
jgi:HlyD family secretion protein